MTMLIESYSYIDVNAPDKFQSTHTIVIESTGGTPYTLRHDGPKKFTDVLADWQAQAQTATGELVTLAYSEAADRVTIANAAGNFDVTLPGSLAAWLGFASATLTGAASYTGTLGPMGILQPLGVDIDAAEHVEHVELRDYRLGRTAASVWHAMQQWGVEVVVHGTADQARLLGWLTAGRVAVVDATGYAIDGFVVVEQDTELAGQDDSTLIRRMTVVAPSTVETAEADIKTYGGLWGAVRYGWGAAYWVQIAGTDTIYSERPSDLAPPTGWALEEAALSIDASSEVGAVIDRQNGIGVGLSLSIKLLDTGSVRDLFARPTAATWLTQSMDGTDTTAVCESLDTFDTGSGVLHIGLERMTYAGTTGGTTFTGLDRATGGSLAYAHKSGFVGQAVTNRIVWWRGRPVVLWAAPIDPAGLFTGSSLDDESVQVWKGRVEADPHREEDGFVLQCQSLDRVIAQELPQAPTGTVIGTGEYAVVEGPLYWSIAWEGFDDTGAGVVGPFALTVAALTEFTPGELITSDQFYASLQAAWAAAVASASAGSFVESFLDLTTFGNPSQGYVRPAMIMLANAATSIYIDLSETIEGEWVGPGGGATIADGYRVDLGWPIVGLQKWQPGKPLVGYASSVTVELDDAVVADVPAAGRLRLTWENLVRTYNYSASSTNGNVVIFGGLTPADPVTPPIGVLTDMQGVSAAVATAVDIDAVSEPFIGGILTAILVSSGTGLRGALDELTTGYGLSADDLQTGDDADFVTLWPLTPIGVYDTSGKSFEQLAGGLLALQQRALVLRSDPADPAVQRLCIVDTVPSGSNYTVVIGNGDLLGWGDNPVARVERLTAPNAIKIIRLNGPEEYEPITINQLASIQAQGQRSVEWQIVAESRDDLVQLALDHAPSWLQQDGTGQAVDILVPPWVDAHQGDVVWLDALRHPALWQWGSQTSGYTGPARVTGRTMDLVSMAVTLTLLVDGSYQQASLSPAMRVVGFDDATTPTTIEVSDTYFTHCKKALELGGGGFDLICYVPCEDETAANGYGIDAVIPSTGGVIVLFVSGIIGTPTLQATAPFSYLTLPVTADCTEYQAGFAHDSDGTYWV